MRKLLAILGAIGLTATASTSVVACTKKDGQDPNLSMKDINSFVKKSKDDQNISVLFIGGRKNSDSLSFLGAIQAWTTRETTSNTQVLDETKITNADKSISNFTTQANTSYSGYKKELATIIPNAITNPGNNPESWGKDSQEWFGYQNKEVYKVQNISLKTLLVNDITTFWKSSNLGSDVRDLIFGQLQERDTIAKQTGSVNDQIKEDDKQKESSDSNRKATLKSALTKDGEGPYFLIFRSGKLVGITSGYANYRSFNPEIKDTKESVYSGKTVNDDLNNFFKTVVEISNAGWTWMTQINQGLNSNKVDNLFQDNKAKIDDWSKRDFNATNNIKDLNDLNTKETPKEPEPKPDDKDKEKPGPENPNDSKDKGSKDK